MAEKKEDALDTFTKKFLSHGYPIDRDMCKENGLPVVDIKNDLEDKIGDLHAMYINLMMELKTSDILVIQTSAEKSAVIDGEDISASV